MLKTFKIYLCRHKKCDPVQTNPLGVATSGQYNHFPCPRTRRPFTSDIRVWNCPFRKFLCNTTYKSLQSHAISGADHKYRPLC